MVHWRRAVNNSLGSIFLFTLRSMAFAPFDPQLLTKRLGSWLSSRGPESDVVVSCRVRLARNLEGFPFVTRLKPERAGTICEQIEAALRDRELDGEAYWVPMEQASPVLRLLLRERHLVSRDLAPTDPRLANRPGRAVAFNIEETVSVMINEEDHLRLQSLSPGFSLRDSWERIKGIDLELEEELGYSYSDQYGYLTGCPTNVGTGLRASVMLHLPALGLVRKELAKVFSAAQSTGLAVRGMYGEGSRAAGDFYQISNQVTLGRSEEQLIEDLEHLVPRIVDFEQRVRSMLYEEHASSLEERIQRSLETLSNSRSLRTEVALMHLSNVRLGACLGLSGSVSTMEVNCMAVQIQKGHVHTLSGGSVDSHLAEPTERDMRRARFLRKRLAELSS
jgi:protein arginine kinase